ncbi:hypothetical protein AMTRI_Chr13g90200 [Amborella trichopoda]
MGSSCVMLPSSLSRICPSFGLKKQVELRKVSMVECSSRPQKKATSHHMKTRPRKRQAWDIKRGPTVYPPLPPLPPDWSLDPSTPVQLEQQQTPKMDE